MPAGDCVAAVIYLILLGLRAAEDRSETPKMHDAASAKALTASSVRPRP